jgi:hypothetical protein
LGTAFVLFVFLSHHIIILALYHIISYHIISTGLSTAFVQWSSPTIIITSGFIGEGGGVGF